tara:strand:- start:1034 stop:1174 length:141 start_codon:yes stop_codon:yes gene_type:complete
MAFKINPNDAKHTPLSLMLEMLEIHAQVELLKSEEVEKHTREIKNG